MYPNSINTLAPKSYLYGYFEAKVHILLGTWTLWGYLLASISSESPRLTLEALNRLGFQGLPIGPKVVPSWGSYLEFYKVIPKRNYFGASG